MVDGVVTPESFTQPSRFDELIIGTQVACTPGASQVIMVSGGSASNWESPGVNQSQVSLIAGLPITGLLKFVFTLRGMQLKSNQSLPGMTD